MKTLKQLKSEWMTDASTHSEYLALADEFNMARELVAARTRAGLTQAEVAERMGTTQSVVARLEGGGFAIALALIYGGYRVIAGGMTPGTFFSFTAAVLLLYGPVRQLSRMVNTVQQSLSSVERVFEIVDTPQAIVDAINKNFGDGIATALDGTSVAVRAPYDPGQRVTFMGMLENIEITPDAPAAKVVVNSRTASPSWSGHAIIVGRLPGFAPGPSRPPPPTAAHPHGPPRTG